MWIVVYFRFVKNQRKLEFKILSQVPMTSRGTPLDATLLCKISKLKAPVFLIRKYVTFSIYDVFTDSLARAIGGLIMNYIVLHPVRETLKRYTTGEVMGLMHPKFNYVFLGHATCIMSRPNYF